MDEFFKMKMIIVYDYVFNETNVSANNADDSGVDDGTGDYVF